MSPETMQFHGFRPERHTLPCVRHFKHAGRPCYENDMQSTPSVSRATPMAWVRESF